MRESKISLAVMVGGVVMLVTGIVYWVFGFVLIGGICTVAGACMCIMDRGEKKRREIQEQINELEEENRNTRRLSMK